MARTVRCVVLKKEAEGLDKPMHPGELGERIFENVSKDGWKQWLERLTTIINENGLSTADIEGIELIEKHMRGFFFGEGDYGHLPAGFRPPGAGARNRYGEPGATDIPNYVVPKPRIWLRSRCPALADNLCQISADA